jgi:hypothetical protein
MANRDYDGGYLPTHVVRREEMLEMAKGAPGEAWERRMR